MPDVLERGWGIYEGPSGIQHIAPINDLRDHDVDHKYEAATKSLTLSCWCNPCYVDGRVVHHSADHREDEEEGRHVCEVPTGEA